MSVDSLKGLGGTYHHTELRTANHELFKVFVDFCPTSPSDSSATGTLRRLPAPSRFWATPSHSHALRSCDVASQTNPWRCTTSPTAAFTCLVHFVQSVGSDCGFLQRASRAACISASISSSDRSSPLIPPPDQGEVRWGFSGLLVTASIGLILQLGRNWACAFHATPEGLPDDPWP
jgi:hypothetical protein